MPYKNEEEKELSFSCDGGKTFQKINEVSSITARSFDGESIIVNNMIAPQKSSMTIDFHTYETSKILYSFFNRSNNWLRLHGFPMVKIRQKIKIL
jgi:hypothetical protein